MSLDGDNCFGLLAREQAHRIGQQTGPRAHVLVCAPSNSALDEIVLRTISNGLMDGTGGSFTPNVVRMGVHVHHSVKSVALDALVEARHGGKVHYCGCGHQGSLSGWMCVWGGWDWG